MSATFTEPAPMAVDCCAGGVPVLKKFGLEKFELLAQADSSIAAAAIAARRVCKPIGASARAHGTRFIKGSPEGRPALTIFYDNPARQPPVTLKISSRPLVNAI
jgi:hypothetical protein